LYFIFPFRLFSDLEFISCSSLYLGVWRNEVRRTENMSKFWRLNWSVTTYSTKYRQKSILRASHTQVHYK